MIGDAARDLAAMLTTAGVPTTTDPRNLNPPAAWLVPALIDYERLDTDAATVEWELYLIAPDTTPDRAMNMLHDLTQKVSAVVPPGEVTPMTLELHNHGPDGLPAFLINLTTTVTKDDTP